MMKKYSLKITVFLIITSMVAGVEAQVIGDGIGEMKLNYNYDSVHSLSGYYSLQNSSNGPSTTSTGNAVTQQWQHLVNFNHCYSDNYSLQIVAPYFQSKSLFFRINNYNSNGEWHELATRGKNTFIGNQIINGTIGIDGVVTHGKLQISGEGKEEGLCLYKDASSGATTRLYVENTKAYLTRGGDNSKGLAIDINGDIAVGKKLIWGNSFLGYDQGGAIKLNGNSTSATPYIDFTNSGSSYNARLILSDSQRFSISGNNGISVSGGNGSISLSTKQEEEIVVYNSIKFDGRWNNCIGAYMGTYGSQGFDLQVYKNLNSDIETKEIGLYSLGWYHLVTKEGTRKVIGLLSGNYGLRFYTNGANLRMNITEQGIVQIFQKLETPDVEVKNLTLPDYVFADDYNLRSLEEVKDFVSENQHLPEVPSAAEVAENGMSVVEMNNTLLKKVEELTLYLIEQNEKLKQQNEKLEQQNERIEKLEKQNIRLIEVLKGEK